MTNKRQNSEKFNSKRLTGKKAEDFLSASERKDAKPQIKT